MKKKASEKKAIGEVRKTLQNATKRYKIWVACSGGADSLALAYSAYHAVVDKTVLGAIIVDHQMQEGSAEVARNTAKTLKNIGYDNVVIKKVQVPERKNKENAAREARYGAFIEVIHNQDINNTQQHIILTAHTKNDQAESVLLGLARGSGLKSISGIPQKRKLTDNITISRPFLNISREQTEYICKSEQLEFWVDPTNGTHGEQNLELPLRSQIRNTAIPYLQETLNPQIIDALAKTAEIAAETEKALSETVKRGKKDAKISETDEKTVLSVPKLASLSPAIRKRIIKECADRVNMSTKQATTKKQVDSIGNLVTNWHGQKPIVLAGAVVFRETGNKEIVFLKNPNAQN
ncbi:MAG: tRNA lysidine(34) synthetase TilS [Bifidobacteriaceae bacterium]|nr:tRNA lysidine(34) synthetase TilS [Bifidobacteriaceae bacterium]